MTEKFLVCIECPIGCEITVGLEGNEIQYIRGNSCPRGKMYAEDEIVCPKRILTSTVRAKNGKLVPVKTDKPIPKKEMFEAMEKIKQATCDTPIKIGDIVIENISQGVHLISTGNME
jgi:CxxC motif-containing protein